MPPKKSEDITLLLERKFDELKDQFLNEFKQRIQEVVEEEFKKVVENYESRTTILESDVKMLQEHVNYLKDQNEILRSVSDDMEQYSRRQCLRFYGVPKKENETSDDVVNTVHNLIKVLNCDIPLDFSDRAHRIGHQSKDIIVKFCSFRHRTVVYKARKKYIDNVRIGIDLTKKRYLLLKDAKDHTVNNSKVKFVYADLNCNLKIHSTAGPEYSFKSIEELDIMLSKL